MKIAHITSVHNDNDNRIFYKECYTLYKNGFEVYLIVAGAETRVENGIKIVGFPKEQRRVKRVWKTSLVDMIKICNSVNADIYHFHDPELIFTGLYLKFVKNKIVIYDIHENNPASILSKPYIKSKIIKKFLAKFFDFFEKVVSGFFDALVSARPDISKRFNHPNIITLRNFPILPDFSNIKDIDISKNRPVVIYVGGMTKIRGINELLDAFEDLDDCELWLLGPVTEKELENRITNNPKNVKYLGIVEANEVFSYIKKADIGIITFLPVPNHLETLATKPFEYMACGKPIIMSDFRYWRDTFKKSALYVDPIKPDEIKETILKLINDRELMNKMGQLNKILAYNKYNWEKESKKLVELYEGFKK